MKSRETTLTFGEFSVQASTAFRAEKMDEVLVALIVVSVISIMVHEFFGRMRGARTVTVADAWTQTESSEEKSATVQTDTVDERVHGRIPLEIAVPRTGHCYHVPTCGHVRNRPVTTFRRCMDCLH